MTAPALKIKAFMGTIKEACFDVGNGDPFESLLQMELVLRGVLPAAEKLWHQIQSSIGKPLVTMSSLPPPLLAGANVLAGRLAEAMEDETHNKIPIESSIVQRAKDISDMRWIILLQQTHFRDIARGYFCTAASIQIDTPPMWKKVWNTWGDEDAPVGKTPYEAQVAIENLIRIASEKGNTKRVAELQVRLVASYVNKERMTTSTVKIGKQEISVAQAFGDDFTKHLQLPANATFKAQQVIQQLHTNELSDVDKPWFPVVQWQVGIAQEDAIIESRALEQHKTNQNRSVASLLGTCRSKIRTNVYLEDLDPIHNTSLALRDSIARLWNQEKGDDSYWSPSLESFNDCLQRLRDRALAKIQDNISRDQDWRTLLDFILPLFQGLEESSRWNSDQEQNERISLLQKWIAQTSADEKTTISILALTFAQVCWMLLANGMDYSLDSYLYFVIDLLSVLIQYTAPQEWQTAVAVGATNQQVSQTQQWKEARSILVCVMGSPKIVEQITRDAVATKQQTDTSLGYLQCIVAWSGWYQRSWSFCANLSDVRRLLIAAQLSGGKRSLGTIERVLLELASADAELLNGGFPKEAEESFIKLLDILKEHADAMDSVVRAILESHCYNGLARVCRINNGRELARVHELAQRTLDLLADLKVPERVKPLYIWHDSSVFLMSISYQRSIARQLIADSLTSRGQMGEARSFLEVAVEDAPQDAGAALALGAFLLRVAFYMEEERYPDSAKVAQVQLLKAAKLDPTQADPFALLGVWFEESGDSNRAIGCYTKSLALDPCHPIAGRGLLRLKARESIKNELDIAIDMNSPVSGWAWRARGLEAEDEFAVVALLKALRSRDISAPENEYLGIFYQPPDVGYVNDRADALADLAACYRRLARFTASIRAYHASIESAGEHTSSAVLCACAQGEQVSS